jgi:acetyltransferase-like isoleucine patch superfamily enzyme
MAGKALRDAQVVDSSLTGSGSVSIMHRQLLGDARNRFLQALALNAPGGDTVRPWLHRRRGVEIGEGTWIGLGAMIEPGFPRRVVIGKGVMIGIRVTIIAHFEYRGIDRRTGEVFSPDEVSVRIEDDVFIGSTAVILPDVTIGHGAVVTAGSVVSRPVPPLTMVQGNPAKPVARSSVPLGLQTPLHEYYRQLRPFRAGRGRTSTTSD